MATGKLLERYSQAVNSGSLVTDPRTTWSDTDVLGAAGLAARHHSLGIALTRMFADGKPEDVVRELTDMAFKRARTIQMKLSRVEAEDLSKTVLGWHRFGICQPCGGTGYLVIKDTPVHGDECHHCRATGKLPFDSMFLPQSLELAKWLSAEIDRSQSAAGSAAMAMLAPRMEL